MHSLTHLTFAQVKYHSLTQFTFANTHSTFIVVKYSGHSLTTYSKLTKVKNVIREIHLHVRVEIWCRRGNVRVKILGVVTYYGGSGNSLLLTHLLTHSLLSHTHKYPFLMLPCTQLLTPSLTDSCTQNGMLMTNLRPFGSGKRRSFK